MLSQSLNTDQVKSDFYVESRALSPYMEPQSLSTNQGNSDTGTNGTDCAGTTVLSQSLNTNQGNSDVAGPVDLLAQAPPYLSQSLNTDQGNSDRL